MLAPEVSTSMLAPPYPPAALELPVPVLASAVIPPCVETPCVDPVLAVPVLKLLALVLGAAASKSTAVPPVAVTPEGSSLAVPPVARTFVPAMFPRKAKVPCLAAAAPARAVGMLVTITSLYYRSKNGVIVSSSSGSGSGGATTTNDSVTSAPATSRPLSVVAAMARDQVPGYVVDCVTSPLSMVNVLPSLVIIALSSSGISTVSGMEHSHSSGVTV